MPDFSCDVLIAGGGIVGLATGLALVERFGERLVIVEAEPAIARHQTGHNSGVIHSGLYYAPGSHKARLCADGRERLYRFCEEHGVPHERCGKVVVAASEEERGRLGALRARGEANGLRDLRVLSGDELREIEPHARGVAALHVAETGIVNYAVVSQAFADVLRRGGARLLTGARVTAVRQEPGGLKVVTTAGTVASRTLVNCAGLQSDRVARLCGADPDVRIVPFRGEYYEVGPSGRHLVKHLIYPVPDPRFPFLGVHFTRRVEGTIEAGPNAVIAFRREGYRRWDVSPRDMADWVAYPGFWRMGWRMWRAGVREFARSLRKAQFTHDLQKLVPAITAADLAPGGAGVRAQAVDRAGRLVDDFRFAETPRAVHVLNAPSPAATASLAIGLVVAQRALAVLA